MVINGKEWTNFDYTDLARITEFDYGPCENVMMRNVPEFACARCANKQSNQIRCSFLEQGAL